MSSKHTHIYSICFLSMEECSISKCRSLVVSSWVLGLLILSTLSVNITPLFCSKSMWTKHTASWWFQPILKVFLVHLPTRSKNNNYLKAPPRQPHDFRFLSESKSRLILFNAELHYSAAARFGARSFSRHLMPWRLKTSDVTRWCDRKPGSDVTWKSMKKHGFLLEVGVLKSRLI